ncbi:hypothetical protein [Sulfurimonas sp. HSL3-7]|uniref:hypothetical protein n=1 Tax=Sulfonitrofixus jiaomeiensis TaxID=3131938 RepID=UPI0031FA1826
MKRQINTLVALFFIITTLTTSLHELLPNHNSSDCQVCTLVQHDNALAPETNAPVITLFIGYEALLFPETEITASIISTRNPRAPPLFS